MNVNDIVFTNDNGFGLVNKIENNKIYVQFSEDYSKNYPITTKLLFLIPKQSIDTLLNMSITDKPFSRYSYRMYSIKPNILNISMRNNQRYNEFKLNLENLSLLSGSNFLNRILATLQKDIKNIMILKYYTLTDYDFFNIKIALNNWVLSFFDFNNIKLVEDSILALDDTPNAIYNLFKAEPSFSYLIYALISRTPSLENSFNFFVKNYPLNKKYAIDPNNFNQHLTSSLYYIHAHIYICLKNDMYMKTLELLFSYSQCIFYNIDSITNYLNTAYKKINDLNVIILLMRNLDDLDITTVAYDILFKIFPYEQYKNIYLQNRAYLNMKYTKNYIPADDCIDFLTANSADINYILKNIKELVKINSHHIYSILYEYYSVRSPFLLIHTDGISEFFKNFIENKNYNLYKYRIEYDKFLKLNSYEYNDLDKVLTCSYYFSDYQDNDIKYDIVNINVLIGEHNIINGSINYVKNEVKFECYYQHYYDDNANVALIAYKYAFSTLYQNDENFKKQFLDLVENSQKVLHQKEIIKLTKEIDNLKTALNNNQLITLDNKSLVKFLVKIHLDYNILLELEIGNNNKMYIVKNIATLVDSFNNKSTVKYGKFLTFEHTLNNLLPPYNEFINYLTNNFNFSYGNRYLKLSSFDLRNILKILTNCYIALNDELYLVSNESFKPEILIDDDFNLKITNLKNYEIHFFDNANIIIDKDNKKIMLLEESDKTPLYVFAFNHNNKNFKDVKDNLIYDVYARSPKEIKLSDNLKNNISLPEVNIKAYFDYENDNIILNATYEVIGLGENINPRDYDYAHVIDKFESYMNKLGFKNNMITDSNLVIAFLMLDFTYLKSLADVYLSETLQNKSISIASLPTIRMNYHSGITECFLEESIYSNEELLEILKAMRKKKRYVLLKGDKILAFKEEDMHFAEVIDNLGLASKQEIFNKKQAPLYQTFKNLGLYENISTDNFINEMFNDITNFKRLNINVPSSIKADLRPYQIDGFKWLSVLSKYHLGGILADDMGLGKTLEVITLLASFDDNTPNLIVCPKSLIFNWISEIYKFCPTLKAISIYGSQQERENQIKNIKNISYNIYITSYESLLRDEKLYDNIEFNYVILDEAQAIKNVLAQKSKAVKNIKAKNKLALTGTPIENQLLDLWSIFDFLMPNFFPSVSDFKNIYKDDENLKHLALKITPFILRRTKNEVLKDLPPKYETILTVDLTTEERKMYDAFILNAKQILATTGQTFNILPILVKLRQVCIAANLVNEKYQKTSSKLKALVDLINDYTSKGHKILVFSAFVEVLNLIEPLLTENNINYYKLTGNTKASERLKLVEDFNGNRRIGVFLISLKAGGVGLNLVGADKVIHVDPWWNVAAENQASDRAHRIGQVNNVEVIKLIAENTIEQRIIQLQNMKKDLIDKVINNSDAAITKLSKEDLMFILS